MYWNLAAEDLYGWKTEEVIDKKIYDITVPKINNLQAKEIMDNLVNGDKWRGTFVVQNKSGDEFEAYVIDSPIISEGELIGIVGLSVNFTQMINDREDLVINNLTVAMESNLSDLMESLMHTLNNHLMVAKSNLSLISVQLNHLSESEIRVMLNDAIESVDIMSNLSRQLQIITGKKSFFSRTLNISDVISEMKIIFDGLDNIVVITELDTKLENVILDQSHLESLIMSIIMLNSGVKTQIQSKMKIKTTNIHLEKEKIDELTQSSALSSNEYVCLSLSLPESIYSIISINYEHPFLNGLKKTQLVINSIKRMLDAYQGLIEFSDEKNQLHIYFPVVVSKTGVKPKFNFEENHLPPGSKILIADDNTIIQRSLLRILKPLDLVPTVVDNGYDLIKELENKNDYKFLIFDLKMPKMDGIQVIKYLRDNHFKIPYLIISGHHENINQLYDKFEKIPPILPKPFSHDQLIQKISEIVQLD